jgi:hypothetical protein
MRSIVAASSLALLLLNSAVLGAQPRSSRSMMSDPVFGIAYDPQRVRFEYSPERIGRLCPDLQNRRFWLYAYSKEGTTEYFVISNRESETSGVGVVLRGTQCVVGLPDWVLTGDSHLHPEKAGQSIRFSNTAVIGLASDLCRRYSIAFGGKDAFLSALHKDGLPLNDLLPSVRHAVYELSRTP